MKTLIWIGLLLSVAACAPPAPPPLLPPPPPPPTFSPPPSAHFAGAHVLLDVDLGAVWREKMEDVADAARHDLARSGIVYATAGVQADRAGEPEGDHGGVFAVHIRDEDSAGKAHDILESLCGMGPLCVVTPTGPRDYSIALADSYRAQSRDDVLKQSADAIHRALAPLATAQPVVNPARGNRIVVDIPGYADLDALRNLLAPPSDVTLRGVDDAVSPADIAAGHVPGDVEILEQWDVPGVKFPPVAVYKAVLMSGARIRDARVGYDRNIDSPNVRLLFDAQGAGQLAAITRANVGKRLAFVRDGVVLEAPNLMDPIEGGALVMNGNFTDETAAKMAALLRHRDGPAPWKIVALWRN